MRLWNFLRDTLADFMDDACPRMAAALAYYAVFSLPALLVLIVQATGMVWGRDAIEGRIGREIANLIGSEGADVVQEMITAASLRSDQSIWAMSLGALILLFGATGAFAQLQDALNVAWEVRPENGGLRHFLAKRLLSFGLILTMAFLLLISLALTAGLAAITDSVAAALPIANADTILFVAQPLVALAVIGLLFAVMFKFLPDAEIRWRDVWAGAGITAVLFLIGKFLIGFYLGRSDPGSSYGAAGTLVLLMVWIYYASMIVLFGAEITQRWAKDFGSGIEPDDGAVRVIETTQEIPKDSADGGTGPPST